jgi:cyclophilin family peptidyl-prolyl cis-trans isomerase
MIKARFSCNRNKLDKKKQMKHLHLTTLFIALMVTTAFHAKTKKPKLEPGIYAEITTTKGVMLLKLEHVKTPMTVANFVGLAEGKFTVSDTIKYDKPFYDGLKFHRVIANFMVQGGDPDGNGSGGPEYRFYDEIDPSLVHDTAGILSMANSGPATNGSQFFITHKETPWLNGKHTIFGHIVSGYDVINKIEQNDVMQTVKIIRVGKEARKWNATEVFNDIYSKLKKIDEEKEIASKKEEEERNKYITEIKDMPEAEYTKFMLEDIKKKYPKAQQSPSGMVYIIETPGAVEKPEPGQTLSVHYKGVFRKGEQKFDASYDRGEPMSFSYMQQRMIPGFEEGLAMIGKGGKIKVFIPYFQAYGAQGRPGAIPPYSDLLFDIEMVNISEGGHDEHDGHDHDGNGH